MPPQELKAGDRVWISNDYIHQSLRLKIAEIEKIYDNIAVINFDSEIPGHNYSILIKFLIKDELYIGAEVESSDIPVADFFKGNIGTVIRKTKNGWVVKFNKNGKISQCSFYCYSLKLLDKISANETFTTNPLIKFLENKNV